MAKGLQKSLKRSKFSQRRAKQIIKRMEEDWSFTSEWIRRIEAEIEAIKKHVGLAT